MFALALFDELNTLLGSPFFVCSLHQRSTGGQDATTTDYPQPMLEGASGLGGWQGVNSSSLSSEKYSV